MDYVYIFSLPRVVFCFPFFLFPVSVWPSTSTPLPAPPAAWAVLFISWLTTWAVTCHIFTQDPLPTSSHFSVPRGRRFAKQVIYFDNYSLFSLEICKVTCISRVTSVSGKSPLVFCRSVMSLCHPKLIDTLCYHGLSTDDFTESADWVSFQP